MAEFDVKPVAVDCPYCGEPIELLVDCSEEEQGYVEDCQVCCRPISVHICVGESGIPSVQVAREDEV